MFLCNLSHIDDMSFVISLPRGLEPRRYLLNINFLSVYHRFDLFWIQVQEKRVAQTFISLKYLALSRPLGGVRVHALVDNEKGFDFS